MVLKKKKENKKRGKGVKKKSEKKNSDERTPKSKKPLFKTKHIRMKIVGIGGGGSAIVSEIAKNLKKGSFATIDCDRRVNKKGGKKVKVVQLGKEITGGLGTGMNGELGRRIAEESKEKITNLLKDQDLVILIASMGGGFASGALPIFSEIAKNQKSINLGIFTLPFSFEGEKKMELALSALEKTRDDLSGRFIVSNEKIFQIADKKTPLKKALSSLNKPLIMMLEDLIEVISKPGLINIDFADLKTILKGRGKSIYFGSALTQGPNRTEEVVKNVFQDPAGLGNLENSNKMLFNIKGGEDLTLKEVEKISNDIYVLNKKAKIIFGISEDTKYNGKIKLSLVGVGENPTIKKAVSPKKKKEKKVERKEEEAKKEKNEKEKIVEEKKEKPKKRIGKTKRRKVSVKLKSEKKENKIVPPKVKKKNTRRTGLELKKAREAAEKEEWDSGDSEWEIPAFLRKK
jgi:cell division protein FtsZ